MGEVLGNLSYFCSDKTKIEQIEKDSYHRNIVLVRLVDQGAGSSE
jgi:hypothetical protein